jgi:hypothetical protein
MISGPRVRASLLRAAVALIVSATLASCDPDPTPACTDTYRHLLELGRRNDDTALMERFVTACAASYDPARLSCIGKATTPGEALACKPVRKRPG